MDYSPGLNSGTALGTINTKETTGLVPVAFDYIGLDYSGSTTDVYTYKTGGSGGTTVAIVTVTWTSSAKTIMSNVIRT